MLLVITIAALLGFALGICLPNLAITEAAKSEAARLRELLTKTDKENADLRTEKAEAEAANERLSSACDEHCREQNEHYATLQRQYNALDGQIEGYVTGTVDVIVENAYLYQDNERLTGEVQQLKGAQQTRDKKGHFGPKVGTIKVEGELNALGLPVGCWLGPGTIGQIKLPYPEKELFSGEETLH